MLLSIKTPTSRDIDQRIVKKSFSIADFLIFLVTMIYPYCVLWGSKCQIIKNKSYSLFCHSTSFAKLKT